MNPNFVPETAEEAAAINADLLQALSYGDEGEFNKRASAAGSNMIRRRIRENGYLRNIIPPQPRKAEECDRSVENVQQRIIEDMEPHSRGAVTLSFNDAPDGDIMQVGMSMLRKLQIPLQLAAELMECLFIQRPT